MDERHTRQEADAASVEATKSVEAAKAIDYAAAFVTNAAGNATSTVSVAVGAAKDATTPEKMEKKGDC